jgi:hypothetical protein
MPGIIEVAAKKNENSAVISYEFGENLEEMVNLFTETVTFSNARSQMKVGLQAAMRRRLEAGQSCEDLTTTYKPGVTSERIVDPIAAAKAKFATMDEDARAEFLEALRAMG